MRTKIATIEIFQLDDKSLTAQVFEPILPIVIDLSEEQSATFIQAPALEVWADKGSTLMHKLAIAIKKWKGWK